MRRFKPADQLVRYTPLTIFGALARGLGGSALGAGDGGVRGGAVSADAVCSLGAAGVGIAVAAGFPATADGGLDCATRAGFSGCVLRDAACHR